MDGLTSADRERIAHQTELLARLRALQPRATPVYFAHFAIRSGERDSDLLLGSVNAISPGLSVIDWQSAPLAEAFFACGEGDDYELELEGRTVKGRVLSKTVVGFDCGELAFLEYEGRALIRGGDGWRLAQDLSAPFIPPRPPVARVPFRSPLEVQLDPAQQRIVDLPAQRHALILGEAGFGKTTVALHRLAALQQRGHGKFKGAVIVPTPGLKRLTEVMLERKRVPGVDVFTYEQWAAQTARRAFIDLPKKESVNTTSEIVKLKRHRALKDVLPAFVRARPKPATEEHRSARSKARARRADLEHLFGDRDWMRRVVDAAAGGLRESVIAEVFEHTRIQFLEKSETEHAHFDKDRLATIDGRSIDEGTPMEDVRSVDPEDYAVLFEIERLRAAAAGDEPISLARYDCIVVDEAQELAPLELTLIGRTLHRGGALIVAGDAAQQVDPTAHFAGWDEVMGSLGAREHERAVLQVSYRCPADVTALARRVLDPATPRADPEPSVTRARLRHGLHATTWIIEALRRLRSDDPSASVAIITRFAPSARVLARVLDYGLPVRLALEGDFEFRAGISVTCVAEVKGLEFDVVVLPDADALTYSPTPEARRALYVAVTRATHRLALAAPGAWSELLR